jgi:hypothetical protein
MEGTSKYREEQKRQFVDLLKDCLFVGGGLTRMNLGDTAISLDVMPSLNLTPPSNNMLDLKLAALQRENYKAELEIKALRVQLLELREQIKDLMEEVFNE